MKLAPVLAALMLAGCATQASQQSTADTFCIGAKKIQWSINDTPETIRRAEVWNGTIDRKCGGAIK